MRISDWSSDVCSSDLPQGGLERKEAPLHVSKVAVADPKTGKPTRVRFETKDGKKVRSEEHTSELQSLMRISYAVFCLKKKKSKQKHQTPHLYAEMEQQIPNETLPML